MKSSKGEYTVKRKTFILLILWTFLCIGCSSSSSDPAPVQTQTVQIGVLVPVTGESPINGKAQKAAAELAVEDVNKYLESIYSPTRIEAVIEDTQGSMDEENRLINEVHDKKIPVAVCSMTSNNLGLLKNQIDANGTIVLNEVSTSPSLSVDDNLFRLVPDDKYSAKVMSDLLRENGIEKVIFYYRDDMWGTTLKEELTSAFTAKGGAVADSIVYGFRTYTADMDEKVEQLNASVTQVLTGTAAGKVAVVLLAFEEGIDILGKASAYPVLSTLKWYTGDGLGQNNALLKDATAAAFASKVGLYAPLIAEGSSTAYQTLKTRIQTKTGLAPYSFAPVMYDAVYLAGLTLAEAGSAATPAALKTTLLAKAGGYDAVTGKIVFNSTGDRSTCSYDFWAVGYIGGVYQWVKVYSGRTR
jgi:branched-chain amino acid transport system substrate-binding protein